MLNQNETPIKSGCRVSEKVKSNHNLAICEGKVTKMTEQVNMATIQLNGTKQVFSIDKKEFRTGSKGYYGQGKMESEGKRYQVNIQLVEIGSKPKEPAK